MSLTLASLEVEFALQQMWSLIITHKQTKNSWITNFGINLGTWVDDLDFLPTFEI